MQTRPFYTSVLLRHVYTKDPTADVSSLNLNCLKIERKSENFDIMIKI